MRAYEVANDVESRGSGEGGRQDRSIGVKLGVAGGWEGVEDPR